MTTTCTGRNASPIWCAARCASAMTPRCSMPSRRSFEPSSNANGAGPARRGPPNEPRRDRFPGPRPLSPRHAPRAVHATAARRPRALESGERRPRLLVDHQVRRHHGDLQEPAAILLRARAWWPPHVRRERRRRRRRRRRGDRRADDQHGPARAQPLPAVGVARFHHPAPAGDRRSCARPRGRHPRSPRWQARLRVRDRSGGRAADSGARRAARRTPGRSTEAVRLVELADRRGRSRAAEEPRGDGRRHEGDGRLRCEALGRARRASGQRPHQHARALEGRRRDHDEGALPRHLHPARRRRQRDDAELDLGRSDHAERVSRRTAEAHRRPFAARDRRRTRSSAT